MSSIHNLKTRIYGKSTKRLSLFATKNALPLPDVLAMQKQSYDQFLNKSIEQAMREYYPIKSSNGKVEISYVHNSKRIEKSQTNEVKAIREVKQRGTTYSAKVYAKLNKVITDTGETLEDEVLLCDIPLMTSGGSFIINGSEKVIVSQLIRSPGVYFATKTRDKQSDDLFNKVDVLPRVGSWLEIKHKVSSDLGDNVSIKIKIDKNNQISLTLFLLSLGITYENMFKLFGESEILKYTIEKDKFDARDKSREEIIKEAQDKIFRTIRKGDRVTRETTRNLIPFLLFREKRYNLSETGRFLINRKLSLVDRIIDTYLAQDFYIKVGRNSELLFAHGTFIDRDIALEIQSAFENKKAALTDLKKSIGLTEEVYGRLDEKHKHLADKTHIIELWIYKNRNDKDNNGQKHLIIANDPRTTETHLLISDLVAITSYYFNLNNGIGTVDDLDSLVNKRVVSVGELLLNQFSIGLAKMEKNTREKISSKDISKITPKNITNSKMIQNQIKTFFNSSKLSQFMDQTNPLAKISTKRKITSLGPGGLNRDTAQFDVRDVHSTHYGRICPIETPEGPNIGLILNLAAYARTNDLGFLETPYYQVKNGKIDYQQAVYLTAYDERNKSIAQATTKVDKNDQIAQEQVVVKLNNEYTLVNKKQVDYISVSSNQMTSLAASCIPFLENNDANRALMGSNMQRQAVPLLSPEAPLVATGIEADIAKYSATNIRALRAGKVTYVDGHTIKITPLNSNRSDVYSLRNFERSNQGTVMTQRPLVKLGEEIKAGDLITDASSFDNGEMALGKNLLVGFTTFEGYNYEDAIVVSENLVRNDDLSSIHIDEQTIQFRKSKAGDDELTSEIPNVSSRAKRNLDERGIIIVGSEVVAGDILVGRVSPRGDENIEPAEKLLNGIFNQKVSNKKDTSLKVKNGHQGTIIDVQILSREQGDTLEDGIDMIVKIFIAQKRKIKVGDKMAGRHGNKGVISRVVPVEDMPYLEDGTPLDILLNPQGVPSRMNIGQVFELHLGMIAKMMNTKFVSPVFDGIKWTNISKMLKEAQVPETGKLKIYDPKTAAPFDHPISVGIMYMFKLSHMVDDKMHARSVGPYSLITQQPLGGKSQNGGQRFGEMETWALQSYGASNILQEILTYKSDNIIGRNNLYGALTGGRDVPIPGIPESFNVLAYELRGLGIKIEVHEEKVNNEIISHDDLDDLEIDNDYSLISPEGMEDF